MILGGEKMKNNQNQNLNKFIKISLLGAMAVILMYLEFPIPFFPFPWLKVDLSDIPALIGGLAFGPLAGVIVEAIKNLLILVVKGSETAGVGQLANFIIGVSLVLPPALIYNKYKSKKSLIIGMIVGLISIEIIGILANVYILLPLFNMPMTPEELAKYVTVGLIPFNGIKAVMVSIITFVLHGRLERTVLKKEVQV
jgi:riboflavin transporter